MPKPIEFTQYTHDEATDETVEFVHLIPSVYTVCTECNGEGKSSHYLGVISDEDAADDDWMQDYMSGRFDKPCNTCKGLRVESIMDPEYLDAHPDIRQMVDDHDAEEAEYRATCRAERMFGA